MLENKVVLITGASSGIGDACARELANSGAVVVGVARRKDRLDQLEADIKRSGGQVFTIAADLTEKGAADKVINQAIEHTGRLDCLVNNAGIMLLGPVIGTDVSEWDEMIDLNIKSVLHLTSSALPHLIKAASRPGSVADIVNISSVAGRTIRVGSAVYSATKYAVNAFSESLRQELADRFVRVSIVEPGMTLTELPLHIRNDEFRAASQKGRQEISALQSADIARAVKFIIDQPRHVAFNEVLIRPTEQKS
jgi:NADP-dependent 3-hydroxy acid dehydrogenase YdfG